MGSIHAAGEVGNIEFRPMKIGQVYENCKIARVSEDTYVIVRSTGIVTAVGRPVESINGNVGVIGWGVYGERAAALGAMVKLGVLTAEQVAEYQEAARARHQSREERYRLQALARNCREFKIAIPAAARRRAEKIGLGLDKED